MLSPRVTENIYCQGKFANLPRVSSSGTMILPPSVGNSACVLLDCPAADLCIALEVTGSSRSNGSSLSFKPIDLAIPCRDCNADFSYGSA